MTQGPDQRFMRPIDPTATRRNRHRIRAARVLMFLTNLVFFTALVAGGYWLLDRIQEDARFAIREIEVVGLGGERHAEAMEILESWKGANLFRLDMDRVRDELAGVEWIDEVSVEKALPDRMRVEIVERVPEALVLRDGILRFIDDEGVAFGLAVEGERSYPRIEQASVREARRCVEFLERLEVSDPALHSRIESIRPAGTGGWEVFDRDLGTKVRLGEDDVVSKWRTLYGIVAAERVAPGIIQYADLRFDDQIVIARDGGSSTSRGRRDAEE